MKPWVPPEVPLSQFNAFKGNADSAEARCTSIPNTQHMLQDWMDGSEDAFLHGDTYTVDSDV